MEDSVDTMSSEVQPGIQHQQPPPPGRPSSQSPKSGPGSPRQSSPSLGTSLGVRTPKASDESKSPRHSQRTNQRRPPHKKKPLQDIDQSWRWTGSPIVAPGPLSSPWSTRQRADDREKLSKTNVYLRGLSPTITESELIAMCAPYGRVNSAKAFIDKNVNRGYGFVDFEQSSSAETAVRELRSQGLFARMAKVVSRNTGSGSGDDPTNLYLANLPAEYNERNVENLLNRYGRITSARILRDDNGRSRGVGFARMDSLASCERAISALSGVCNLIPGRPLLVKFADSKKSPDAKSRVRPAASSPQMVWWPNSLQQLGYQQLAVQTPPELMQPLQVSPIQPSVQQQPLQQHVALANHLMGQASMASPAAAIHPGALHPGQPSMGAHPFYVNYGYRYLPMSSAPPLPSPPVMSISDCWSPGEVDGASLVDGLN